jgi:hypothetical protein
MSRKQILCDSAHTEAVIAGWGSAMAGRPAVTQHFVGHSPGRVVGDFKSSSTADTGGGDGDGVSGHGGQR